MGQVTAGDVDDLGDALDRQVFGEVMAEVVDGAAHGFAELRPGVVRAVQRKHAADLPHQVAGVDGRSHDATDVQRFPYRRLAEVRVVADDEHGAGG